MSLRCLLVEDRVVDAELIIDALRRDGFAPDVRRVETPAEFLAELRSPPEIILSDYSLPDFTGLEALALLRERTLEIPFILISGTIGEEVAVECMRLGAADYLLKDRLVGLGSAVRRALAENKLRTERRQSEESYRTLFEQAADGIYISDTDGRLLDANRHGCELVGCERSTLLSSHITDHIIPAERAAALSHLRCAPFAARTDRHRFRRSDGRDFTGEASLNILPDGRLLSIVRDVTERETAERRIREQADLLDQTHDSIVVTDTHGIITFWNRGAEQLGGWTSAEAVGRRIEDLQGPEFLPTVLSLRQAVRQTGAWQQEATMKSKSGESFTVDLRISQLYDQGGHPTGRLNVATDITERKKLQEQFLQAQRMENLGLLAAGIAHDMNNILAPIMMVGPLLSERLPAEADQRLLAMLELSARRGAGLVKQILSFAHGSGGELGAVQLRHIARDIVAMIQETFPRSLTFASDIDPDLWPARANATQIHQVLLNLCVNARDAMPDGGELHLRIANCTLDPVTAAAIPAGRPGRFVVLEVADTGCGIPPELQERIWEPFFTTKDEGKGTGLGLSTVRSIISGHEGFGTLESAAGRGTTFRFYVPADSEGVVAADGTPASFTGVRATGEMILIVDDEYEVRNLIDVILTHHGYRTQSARNGEEALAFFATHLTEIQLVVTDKHMPGLSGGKLIAALRALRPDVRILVCTGMVDSASLAGPAEETLSKPFEANALLTTVERLLKNQNAPVADHQATTQSRRAAAPRALS